MMSLLFFLLISSDIFGVLFTDMKPDQPGFYRMDFDENDNVKYVPIKRPKEGLEKKKDGTQITAFDFTLAKSTCQAINVVRDQKSCGGCWAFSSTDVYGASLCLNTLKNGAKVDKTFSPQYLIDCPDTQTYGGHSYTQKGCQGGYPIIAFMTFNKTSGGGCPEWNCLPFSGTNHSCPTSCAGGGTINKYRGTGMVYVDAYKQSVQTLRDLVTTSGPCVAEMKVYSDLSSYKATDGVYEHKVGGDVEGHAIAIYGFGTENNKNYWLVKNSWGPTWGDGGFFKIRMGLNESGIEDNFYALYDNTNDGDYPTNVVPRPTQTVPGPYWDFEDKPNCPIISSKEVCDVTSGCKWNASTTINTQTHTHVQIQTKAGTRRLRSKNSKQQRLGNVECYVPGGGDTSDACLAKSGCVWYDFTAGSAFCDDWDYDCDDILEDTTFIPANGDTCESFGAEFGLECAPDPPGSETCYPVGCNDAKKKDTCESYDECQWYDHSDDYYPFCDEKGWSCSDFDKNDCVYSTVYGIECELSGDKCVSASPGNCINVDSASKLIIPTLALLVMFFFMTIL